MLQLLPGDNSECHRRSSRGKTACFSQTGDAINSRGHSFSHLHCRQSCAAVGLWGCGMPLAFLYFWLICVSCSLMRVQTSMWLCANIIMFKFLSMICSHTLLIGLWLILTRPVPENSWNKQLCCSAWLNFPFQHLPHLHRFRLLIVVWKAPDTVLPLVKAECQI